MARKKSTVSNRIQNASFTAYSGGQLGDGDRGAYHMLPNYTGNPYDSNDYIFRWRQYCHLYEISWEARKIIRIPIEDAMRKDWEVKGIEEAKANQIKTRLDQLGFKLSLMRAMILERLLGGCLQFFGIEDNRDEPEREYLPRNGYRTRFINTVPISRIARVDWGTDPLKADYMRPEKFLVNGVQVHTSRCLVWDGEPLFDPYDFALTNFRSNISGFGPSKLAPIWDDIVRATGIRQAAFQMAQMNNSIIAALEGYQDLRGTAPGQNKLSEIKKLVNELSVYKAAILDKGKVDVTTLAASFGSVPEMMITSLQILSAASDIPATRFIGQAPGGLNATGESDLENYYNVIDAIQKQRMEPRLRKTYDIIGWQMFPNSWAEDRKKLEFEFPPLWNLSELEEADRTSKIIDNMAKLLENRLITEEKAIEELTKKNVVGVTLDDMDMSSLKDTGLFDEQPNPKESIEKLKQFPVKNSNPESLLMVAAGGKPEDFDERQFKMGMEVEKEHKDVTHGDEVETAKIVLAHLREKPDYYTRLQKVENKGDFKEEEHPRQDDGKFGSKNGTSKTESNKKEKKNDTEKKKAQDEKWSKLMESKTPEDRKAFKTAKERGIKIPPAWKELWINPDKNGNIIAKGKDEKGRSQSIYPVKAGEERDAKKFKRLKDFTKDHPSIMEKVGNDLKEKDEAKVLYLINKTGFRVGGDKDTGADVKAYGASTLMGSHVKVDGNKTTFEFTGKKGVQQKHVVEDETVASFFKEKQGKEERVFNTDSTKVRNYLKSISKSDFKTKDFRTYVATATALRAVQNIEPPKTQKEKDRKILEVAKIVSQKLGNTPVMARDSYIDPAVFKKWEVA